MYESQGHFLSFVYFTGTRHMWFIPLLWPCLFLTLLGITGSYWQKFTAQLFESSTVYFWSIMHNLEIENTNQEKKPPTCISHYSSLTTAGKRAKRQAPLYCIPIKLRVPQKASPARLLSQILDRLEIKVHQFNMLLPTAVQYWPLNLNGFGWLKLHSCFRAK